MKRALVTGGAGFIGSHLVDRLLREQWTVTVADNFHPFYDVAQKRANVAPHLGNPCYRLVEVDICDGPALADHLDGDYDVIVHLAARAGVRPSIEEPAVYQQVNVGGTQNLLDLARAWRVPHFVFASSSSVYGVNPKVPWSDTDRALDPISPYASTKVSGELMGHVYSHLYGLRFLALRFFTVYGPRQRPDLAMHKFATRMLQGLPVPVYGDGSTRRDYTYIADIVDGIRAAMDYDRACFEVINLGCGRPITLASMIDTLEEVLGIKANRRYLPEQPGDVPQTWADIRRAEALLGYAPSTPLTTGLTALVDWLKTSTSINGAIGERGNGRDTEATNGERNREGKDERMRGGVAKGDSERQRRQVARITPEFRTIARGNHPR